MTNQYGIDGLTEDEILEIMQKIAHIHRTKTFDYYTSDDIEQEVFIIILSNIQDFSKERTKNPDEPAALLLEKFLNKIVSNRLKNLYRDKFLVKMRALKTDKNDAELQKRINLAHPLNIDDVSTGHLSETSDIVLEEECWKIVLSNLTDEDMEILDCIMGGEKVTQYYKQKLHNSIIKILENNYGENYS